MFNLHAIGMILFSYFHPNVALCRPKLLLHLLLNYPIIEKLVPLIRVANHLGCLFSSRWRRASKNHLI